MVNSMRFHVDVTIAASIDLILIALDYLSIICNRMEESNHILEIGRCYASKNMISIYIHSFLWYID